MEEDLQMTVITKSTVAIYVTGASTLTSNVASYFDQYQSTFTVVVSVATCAGFIASIFVNMYFRWRKDQREAERHNKEMDK